MGIDQDTAVLAVDGGGTRCRFALDQHGTRHVVTLGAANVATCFETTVATLREGLSRLAAEAGAGQQSLTALPAYLGLAGIVDAEDAARVSSALPLQRARVEDDRRSAVRGALGDADGAVAGLGTGSFFARQTSGEIRLAGGWGARLGDEASGFWIGREALAAALDVQDGLRAQTELSLALLRRFDGPRGIVAFSLGATGTDFAELAPLVTEAADAGDEIALDVLRRGAAHVTEVLHALGWASGEGLCLVGGVAHVYPAFLPREAVSALIDPKGTSLDGAVALARAFAVEDVV